MCVKVDNNRSELLHHPLVTSLLNHKWNKFGAWIYFSNLLFYFVYVFFLTAFGLVVPNPQSDVCELYTPHQILRYILTPPRAAHFENVLSWVSLNCLLCTF